MGLIHIISKKNVGGASEEKINELTLFYSRFILYLRSNWLFIHLQDI